MEEPIVEKEPPISEENEATKEKEFKKLPKRSKEDKNSRKKDEKSVEQVLKALSSLNTPEEKLAAMCKKYTEVFDESKRNQLAVKVAEKKVFHIQREKEQLQGEHSKAVLTRSRLENLCRELQRQNKAMKEESLLRIREEEEKRKEVSAKFHSTLADITTLMQQNTESNAKLRDENLEMQNKFKSVCEQYELREQQVEKISKQMKLESQLAEARLRKAKVEMLAEKEILERDKQALMAEVALCQGKLIDHEKTEEALRAQINVYFEKYDEFQNVLTKSNQVYTGFKGEMEKMSKKITRLEKETSTWKQKWEGSHKALLQLAAEKQLKDAEVQLQARQLAQLQKLCRSLQSERTALLQQLKNLGIPTVVEDSSESEASDAKTKTDENNSNSTQNAAPSCSDLTAPVLDDTKASLQNPDHSLSNQVQSNQDNSNPSSSSVPSETTLVTSSEKPDETSTSCIIVESDGSNVGAAVTDPSVATPTPNEKVASLATEAVSAEAQIDVNIATPVESDLNNYSDQTDCVPSVDDSKVSPPLISPSDHSISETPACITAIEDTTNPPQVVTDPEAKNESKETVPSVVNETNRSVSEQGDASLQQSTIPSLDSPADVSENSTDVSSSGDGGFPIVGDGEDKLISIIGEGEKPCAPLSQGVQSDLNALPEKSNTAESPITEKQQILSGSTPTDKKIVVNNGTPSGKGADAKKGKEGGRRRKK